MQVCGIKDKNTFKGYSARPLKAIVIRNTMCYALNDATRELAQIGKKHNFDVVIDDEFVRSAFGGATERLFDECYSECVSPWIQDKLFFAKGKVLYSEMAEAPEKQFLDYFKVETEQLPSSISSNFAGGNVFMLKKKTALAGSDIPVEDVKKALGVEKVISLPQADFHIDLCVRPLKGKDILVADDDMTLEILEKAQRKLKTVKCPNKRGISAALANCIKNMKIARRTSENEDINGVIKTLEENDFNVIRVPGRIYRPFEEGSDETCCTLNFMNAIAHENQNGDVVLITNKSKMLEKLGLSQKLAKYLGVDFEELFRSKIKDYVKPENVYFIQGGQMKGSNIADILEKGRGGIHCLTLEVPS